jgi:hypothetical protein
VKMISPGINVMPIEKNATMSATPKIISAVVAFCFIVPLTNVCSRSVYPEILSTRRIANQRRNAPVDPVSQKQE